MPSPVISTPLSRYWLFSSTLTDTTTPIPAGSCPTSRTPKSASPCQMCSEPLFQRNRHLLDDLPVLGAQVLRWAASLKKSFGVDPLLDREGQRMRWARRVSPAPALGNVPKVSQPWRAIAPQSRRSQGDLLPASRGSSLGGKPRVFLRARTNEKREARCQGSPRRHTAEI